MKNNRVNKNRSKRKFVIPIVVVVLLVSAFATALYLRSDNNNADTKTPSGIKPQNTVDYTPADPQDSSTNEDRKGSSNGSDTLSNGSTSDSTSADASDFTVTIVNTRVSNGSVRVATMVNGTTSGSCTLTATSGSTTKTFSAVVQQNVNNYDCGVFNESLPSGNWSLKLTVTKGNSSVSDSATVTI